MESTASPHPDPIAIIGIACWYPDAPNPLRLWENVLARRQQFRRLPDQRLPLVDYHDPDPKVSDTTYGQRAAVIDGFEFDWAGRRIPFSTYRSTDVAHWLALETALSAVSDAGYRQQDLPAEKTGVIVGNTLTGEQTRSTTLRLRWPYIRRVVREAAADQQLSAGLRDRLISEMEQRYKSGFAPINEDSLAGGLSNTIAGRICNYLNLYGGGYTVDGACASSLLAVATASERLSEGALDLALAGGVDISLDPFELVGFAKAGALTPTEMRVYDRRGNGFIPGEGCGFVVLKRMADAQRDGDYVYAILHGWGISSDGGRSGITAPSAEGQAKALARAYARASYDVVDLDFIEGHGTGTAVGDRIELEGIALAMDGPAETPGGDRPWTPHIGVTSLKSLIGHTKAASGVGGLIKAVMAVNRRVLPPTAGCDEPHPVFEEKARRLYPLRHGETHAKDAYLRAGISAMGFGGINCHVTVSSAHPPAENLTPSLPEEVLLASAQDSELFVLSATTPKDLNRQIDTLGRLAEQISIAELTDLAAEMASRTDSAAPLRAALVADAPAALVESAGRLAKMTHGNMDAPEKGNRSDRRQSAWFGTRRQSLRVGFLFPGQGAQRVNMGRRLVNRHPWARELFDMGTARIKAAGGVDLKPLLYPQAAAPIEGHRDPNPQALLSRTENAQPAICLISLLYLEYLRRLGVTPTAVGGHSLGELAAFFAAGAYNRNTLLDLATLRGIAMAEAHGEGGGMVSLQCTHANAERLLGKIDDYLILANHNSPRQMVLSGETRAVDQAIQLAAADGILTHRLAVSGAFHSRLGAAAARRIGKEAKLPEAIDSLNCHLFTSTNGTELAAGAPLHQHFVDQIQSRVDFMALVSQMSRVCDQFIEVGPGRALSGLVAEINPETGPTSLPVEPSPEADIALHKVLAHLYTCGLDIHWELLFNHRLTRPFRPPAERVFIINPCEAERDPSTLAPVPTARSLGAADQLMARLTGLSGSELQAYVDRRGGFLADIIQVDRKYMPPAGRGPTAGAGGGEPPYDGRYPPEEAAADAPAESTETDPLEDLKALTAAVTGFPVASLAAEARLLDDLNLDSIKAGDLLMRFAGQLGVAWPGDPRLMANASLAEIAKSAGRLVRADSVDAPAMDQAAPRTAATAAPQTQTGMATQLLNIVEELTGFPRQTLSLELRLLDDLNLDSIKAGDLVSRAMRQLSVTAEVEIRSMANASLQELLDFLGRHRDRRPAGESSAAGALVELTRSAAEITGFPIANLQPDLLVESDLRIGPEMLTAILRQTAARLGIQNRVDIAPLRERSLAQIATILDRMQRHQGAAEQDGRTAAIQQIDDTAHDWVRDFGITLTAEPLPPLPAGWGQRRADDWEEAYVRIYFDPSTRELADALRTTLFELGARVELEALETGQPASQPSSAFSHLLLLLPQSAPNGVEVTDADPLAEMIQRLHIVLTPPPAASAPRKRTTVAFVQFGGGEFGSDPRFAIPQRCATQALAASLHLERSDLRVRCLDFSPALTADQMAPHVVAELQTDSAYAAVGYDFRQRRGRPRPHLLAPADYLPRGIAWGPEDLIVVSGGAKGITAACALAVARETQVRMALLGRSSHPDATPDDPASRAVRQTLDRFTAAGLTAEYYCCDVANRDSVDATLGLIREEMGAITGLIHGAGLNRPRPLDQVSAEDAYAETAPKLNGARHLLAALADQPPKLVMGLTSIIGITGMPGNGWYGFSNEVLALQLLAFSAAHPETQTQSVAYSIWRDEGMGARMGSVDHLQHQGIWSIPTDEGTRRFVHLFRNNPGQHQVAVTARLGGLDTWQWPDQPGPPKARFLEERLIHTPGVESLYRANLSLESDPYLKDHHFQGSTLFPTVFGLEAMAQAAAHAMGARTLRQVCFEEVLLERPITVDPQMGAEILVRAEVLEAAAPDAPTVVQAAIYKAHTGIRTPFFSARLVVPRAAETAKVAIQKPAQATPLIPRTDLYRESLLFQGRRFQRIRRVWQIEAHGDDRGKAIFEAAQRSHDEVMESAFGDAVQHELILGDLFFRDALLQSAALLVPQDRSLPVFIKRWEITAPPPKATTQRLAEVRLLAREENQLKNTVIAIDDDGRVIERLEGYRLKVMQHLPDYPTVAELLDPTERDTRILREHLASVARQAALELPQLQLAYIEDIHTLSKPQRHVKERPLLEGLARLVLGEGSDAAAPLDIVWSDKGKPSVAQIPEAELGLSLTHDERICLGVAGPGPQGCDLTPVMPRPRDRWRDLIGPDQSPLLDALMRADEPLDLAAARIWAAQEALIKASGSLNARLSGHLREGDLVTFESNELEDLRAILTLPMQFTWGPLMVLALVVKRRPTLTAARPAAVAAPPEAAAPYEAGYASLREMAAFDIIPQGPQGQPVFVYRFPISFRPGASPGGGILFSHFFSWMGIMREASAWPIKDAVAAEIKSGRWGSVTNYSHLTILGEGTANDLLEGRVWASANAGPENSSMTFSYDFLKILPDGGYERVAFSRLETTWVEIVGQGEARTAPYPPYYAEFVADMLPRYEAPDVPELQPEPLRPLLDALPGTIYYQAPEGPEAPPPLHTLEVATGWQHANLVGNVYYANYYEWQGLVRDRFFYELDPQPVIPGRAGKEVLCLECRIDHLREAMPFERILITLGMTRLDSTGGRLHFTYHRKDDNGGRIKLASGWQRIVWVERDPQGRPVPTDWPRRVRDGILEQLPLR
ncbi:MAG: SDR family NAD(P)-dependent oxidoreductase [Desulfosarcinaceae bacterium]|nr:SDR family NAD(P)-dependent oxidoreductase [Desulfosarcinaceae bacterium]